MMARARESSPRRWASPSFPHLLSRAKLTHIDLFSGIGGFALACQKAGFKTIAFCEIDPFCREIIKKRFNAITDTEFYGRPEIAGEDTKRRETDKFKRDYSRPILYSDIKEFNGTIYRGATLITGGFPCQPFSVAGKRRSTEDNRYLWPEMFRVIKEIQPRWVLAENVAGIVNLALDEVLADLESAGYETGTVIIPACAVNAPHRRDRVWIIANSNRTGLQGSGEPEKCSRELIAPTSAWEKVWFEVATELCGVDDGLPARLDGLELSKSRHRAERLKALGNAIVPQVAYEIIKIISYIEARNIIFSAGPSF